MDICYSGMLYINCLLNVTISDGPMVSLIIDPNSHVVTCPYMEVPLNNS